jgi:hypothetical protein
MNSNLPRRKYVGMMLGATLIATIMVPISAARATCLDDVQRDVQRPVEVGSGLKMILIDRTTVFAPQVVADLAKKISAWPRGNERVVVLTFGGIAPDLLSLEFDEQFEPVYLSDKIVSNLAKDAYKKYVACATQVDEAARAKLKGEIFNRLSVPDKSAQGNSPILDAIRAASSIFQDPKLKSKSFILISDGIEHSGNLSPNQLTSFYRGGGDEVIGELNTGMILSGLKKEGRIPELTGVKVWHAGIAQPAANRLGSSRSRSANEIASLRSFWREYWTLTRSKFIEFGQPYLLQPLDRE